MRGHTSKATVAPVGFAFGKRYFQWAPGWAKAYTSDPRPLERRERGSGDSDKGG
jgi:hypothetical protein